MASTTPLRTFALGVAWLVALSCSAPAAPAPATRPVASPSASASSVPTADQTVGLHPVLGVQIDINAQTDGLLVDAVLPKSIASRIGLQPGDILLELNGCRLTSLGGLHDLLSSLKHGDALALKYRHGSELVEKKDNLQDVPVLSTYEVIEGRGLAGILEIGYTRAQVEKSLGGAVGEKESNGMVYLAYPFHGITIALMEAGGQPRVVQFAVEYPLVCRTSRGLITGASRKVLDAAYKGETIDTQVMPSGLTIDTIPKLGIQFRSVDGRITRVSIIPLPAGAAPAGHP